MNGANLKVQVVSFSRSGGAGATAASLVQGFQDLGADAEFLFATETNLRHSPFAHPTLTARAALDNYVLKSAKWGSLISHYRNSAKAPIQVAADTELLILKWINGLDLQIPDSFRGKVLWVLDDMNPFTGVCHHAFDCDGYISGCQSCPALRLGSNRLAALDLERKSAFLNSLNNIGFVAPTDWIHQALLKSYVGSEYPSTKIYNPLSPVFFESSESRQDPPSGALRALIVAADLDDPIKGVWQISGILRDLLERRQISLTMIGNYSSKLESALPEVEFRGSLNQTDIRDQMGQADVLLVPSLAETAGMVVAEAASQGVPAIVRSVGGLPEMIGHGAWGWMFGEDEELKSLIGDSIKNLSKKAALTSPWASQMTPAIVASRYLDFSREI